MSIDRSKTFLHSIFLKQSRFQFSIPIKFALVIAYGIAGLHPGFSSSAEDESDKRSCGKSSASFSNDNTSVEMVNLDRKSNSQETIPFSPDRSSPRENSPGSSSTSTLIPAQETFFYEEEEATIVNRPLYYQKQKQKSKKNKEKIKVKVPAKKEVKLTPLTPTPLIFPSKKTVTNGKKFKLEYCCGDTQFDESSFQIQPLGAVHSRQECGEIYDYYHIALDGQFNPGKDILDPSGMRGHHARVSRYTIKAFPVTYNPKPKDDNNKDDNKYEYKDLEPNKEVAYLITSQPETDKGHTDYTSTIEVGLEASAGYEAPASGTASITGHVTYTHSKTRSYQDVQIINISSAAEARAEWIFEINNILMDDRYTSPFSIGMFLPSVQWVWKIKRSTARNELYDYPEKEFENFITREKNEKFKVRTRQEKDEVLEKILKENFEKQTKSYTLIEEINNIMEKEKDKLRYFSFGITVMAEYLPVRYTMSSSICSFCCCTSREESQLSTHKGKVKEFTIVNKKVYRLKLPPQPKGEYGRAPSDKNPVKSTRTHEKQEDLSSSSE